MKRERVRASLAVYEALAPASAAVEPVVPADPVVGYRARAKLVTGRRGALGLFARDRDHEVVDIAQCRVLRPAVGEAAAALRKLLAAPPASADGALVSAAQGGALRAVDLREAIDDGGHARVLVTLVVGPGRAGDRALSEAADAIASACDRVAGVAVSEHDGRSPQVLGRAPRLVRGEAIVRDRIEGGRTYQLAAHGSFVQAHRGQAQAVYAMVSEAIERSLGPASGTVLDLYAGAGALGLELAGRGAHVMLAESFAPAAALAAQAAREQGLEARVDVRAADAAIVARDLAPPRGARSIIGAVIANPPRRGIAPAAREAIARLDPSLIAYVSCDPESLARDLDHFVRLGYAPSRVAPFDMIPLTAEVETVALLARSKPPPPRVLYADDEVVIADKSPHEPTTPHPEHRVSLLDRVRALDGCASAAPVHRLDIGTSGACVFARRPEHVARWAAALSHERASKRYTALARGIVRPKGAIARPLTQAGRTVDARTRYRRSAIVAGHSLVDVWPEQGRTHQIRRHLAAIGHPIVGDDRYGHGATNRYALERYLLDRTFLHLGRLEIVHPRTGRVLAIESPLPADLRAVLARLGTTESSGRRRPTRA